MNGDRARVFRAGAWIAGLCYVAVVLASGCRERSSQPEVVVYVAVDRKDAEPILRQFEQQTRIRVRALYDAEAAKTTGLVTRLIAEKAHPRCDVFWNNEVVQTLLLSQRGLLQPYASPAAEGIPRQFQDPHWTGIATRTRVIVYNTELVPADEAPRTLRDLADDKWKGKVAIANPLFGTTRTHLAALYATWGAEETEGWLQRLLDNDVRIVAGNAMVKNLVARARRNASPILVGLTDTDDVRSGQAQGEPIDFIYPDQDDGGAFVIPATVCLIDRGPHPEAARQLFDYLVGPETEATLTREGTGYAPVRWPPSSPDDPARTLNVTYRELLECLEPSTTWAAENFHR